MLTTVPVTPTPRLDPALVAEFQTLIPTPVAALEALDEATPCDPVPVEDGAARDEPPAPTMRFGATVVELPEVARCGLTIYPLAGEDGRVDYVVFVLGTITMDREYATAISDFVHLLEYAPEGTTVHVLISSDGGSLSSASRMVAAIQRTPAHVVTRAIGRCQSAGSFLWAAGHTRQIDRGAYLMFHMAAHGDGGHSTEIAKNADALVDYVVEVALQPLVEQGLLTAEDLTAIVDKRTEVYLDAATVTARLKLGDAA